MLEKDIKKVLVSHDEIVEAAKKLGETLTKEYQGKNPIFVGILKGSVPFMAELINHVDTHIELDFMLVSSYQMCIRDRLQPLILLKKQSSLLPVITKQNDWLVILLLYLEKRKSIHFWEMITL